MLRYRDITGAEIDKVQTAIDRLRAFEPPEGYYLAFSGGKDSQCVYHLCKMAEVAFDAHYNVTGVDPPELVRFIKRNYPDVKICVRKGKDGRPVTMWNLIPRKYMPPTRIVRYCCTELKEVGGEGRLVLTGVRWEESVRRSKQTMVHHCVKSGKTVLKPIIDWKEQDVLEYLNYVARVPHCELYDQGFTRIGCIGCPMNTKAAEELTAYPKYLANYIRAFERMIKARKLAGKNTQWQTGEDVMAWWLGKTHERQMAGQVSIEEL